MNRMWKKVLPVVLVCTFLSLSISACTGTRNSSQEKTAQTQTSGQTQPAEQSGTVGQAQGSLASLDSVDDTSDLPDWAGKQLKLTTWYSHGTSVMKRATSPQDVVTPEIKRVTGVELDKDKSFDNGGQAVDVKMGLLSATNDWPDLAFASSSNPDKFYPLIDQGKLYDLTELLPKYCPDLWEKMSIDKLTGVKNNCTYAKDGKIYFIPMQLNPMLQYDIDPSTDSSKFAFIAPKQSRLMNTVVYVRDDILKKLYPNAKSQDEIEKLYLDNGKFTQEEIFDVPVKTQDEFVKFMYDIKALVEKEKITENGKPVQVTYANTGGDNWFLLNNFLGSFAGIPGNINYFTYYDKTAKKLEYAWKQDYFKNDMKLFNKLVRDGVMGQDSLLNNDAMFNQLLNGGQYAITYSYKPDEAALKKAGKTYRYRRLWLDQTYQDDKFVSTNTPYMPGYEIAIFKDKVKEEDLPQVLTYLNYMMSDVGEKLTYWGPRSAGLFEEKDGNRVYKDKELEDCMVYGKDNDKALQYNLYNLILPSAQTMGLGTAWPGYPTYMGSAGSKLSPMYTYDRIRSAADAENIFNPATLQGLSAQDHTVFLNPGYSCDMYRYPALITEVDRFWKARESFESALKKTMAASSDTQFEQLFKSFLETAEKNGGTDATLEEMNKLFSTGNANVMDQLNK
jgi:putative aldouronate transport system substrate-binding protein